MRHFLWVMGSFLLAAQGHGQSVDSLVHEALQNNPQVRALQFQAEASRFRARSAGALPPPAVGVEMSQIPTTTGNLWNGAVSNTFSVSQMFMLGGKLSAMSEVEERKGAVLHENLRALMLSVRARVKAGYLQLWFADRQIGAQERATTLLVELIRALETRVLTNSMRQADLYAARVELASEQAKLRELQVKRIGVLGSLNALVGREDPGAVVLTDTAIAQATVLESAGVLSDRLRMVNPSLRSMDRMKEMNDAEIVAADRELYPDIMVQAMLMRMPNGMLLTAGPRSSDMIRQSTAGMAMPRTEWMYGLMATITLPFMPWSAGRSEARADELRLSGQALEAEKASMRNEMLASLRAALSRYAAADTLVRQYREVILPLARQSTVAQTVAYANGQADVTAVLDAQRMELMRHNDYLMAAADRRMAAVDIEMMVGSPIE